MADKKKTILAVICTIAALFITPVIVYAVMYRSVKKENNFAPAQANIQVKEGDNVGDTADELTKEYVLTKDDEEGTTYSVDKVVRIYDERTKNEEELKVTLVPMWYDAMGDVCAGLPGGITDFRTVTLEDNKLVYKNGETTPKTILTVYLYSDGEASWADSWTYDATDGCFCLKEPIKPDNTTPPLVTTVEVSKEVYDAADGYEFHLDVLANAVQTGV